MPVFCWRSKARKNKTPASFLAGVRRKVRLGAAWLPAPSGNALGLSVLRYALR
jgi:hypothetical protein